MKFFIKLKKSRIASITVQYPCDTLLPMLQELRFRLLLSLSRRSLLAIDALTQRFRALSVPVGTSNSRISDPSIPNIEAVFCTPPRTPRAAVLLFHGIGERLIYWRRAQQLLADHHIASLVFHYPGYGRTAGSSTPACLRSSSVVAHSALLSLIPEQTPVFLLGVSLGTAVAADAAPHLSPQPAGMILAQPFCSFRGAVYSVTGSHIAAKLAPDLYPLEKALLHTAIPTLLLHVTGDRLFPCSNTRKLATRLNATHITVCTPEGHSHNSLFVERHPKNWQPIFDFIRRRTQQIREKETVQD